VLINTSTLPKCAVTDSRGRQRLSSSICDVCAAPPTCLFGALSFGARIFQRSTVRAVRTHSRRRAPHPMRHRAPRPPADASITDLLFSRSIPSCYPNILAALLGPTHSCTQSSARMLSVSQCRHEPVVHRRHQLDDLGVASVIGADTTRCQRNCQENAVGGPTFRPSWGRRDSDRRPRCDLASESLRLKWFVQRSMVDVVH